VSPWDGSGLPPAAAARMQRASSSPLATSMLSVPSALGIQSVGFDPVGEVMGCVVVQLGWQGYGGCGVWAGSSGYGYGASAPVISSRSAGYGGFGGYVGALTNGYRTALGRLVTEARALGADGVVGVKLTAGELAGTGNREFVAIGTAIRGRCDSRPQYPFTTELPGTDVAKLLLSGWTPVALQVGIEVAIRHDDWRTQSQAGSRFFNTANVEVAGYTDLVQQTRALAREHLRAEIARVGADGGVVSDLSLRIWELEPAENHRDHVAEAMITGTAIARFRPSRRAVPSPLTILPLRNRRF
jgi:uncharacterized protein YbjQ (UPF0145 family)